MVDGKLEYSVYYNSARRWLLLSKIRDNRDSLRQFVRNKKGEIIGNTWLAKEICYVPCQHSFRTIRMAHSVEITIFFFFQNENFATSTVFYQIMLYIRWFDEEKNIFMFLPVIVSVLEFVKSLSALLNKKNVKLVVPNLVRKIWKIRHNKY